MHDEAPLDISCYLVIPGFGSSFQDRVHLMCIDLEAWIEPWMPASTPGGLNRALEACIESWMPRSSPGGHDLLLEAPRGSCRRAWMLLEALLVTGARIFTI